MILSLLQQSTVLIVLGTQCYVTHPHAAYDNWTCVDMDTLEFATGPADQMIPWCQDGNYPNHILAVTGAGGTPFYPTECPAQMVTLTWERPTESEDGTPLDDLAGYRVYYGNFEGDVSEMDEIGLVESHTLMLAPDKPWHFFVTAIDSVGNESVPSNLAISYSFQ